MQPSFQPPGGGNGVAAWMLQALCNDHDVTVLSWRPVATAPIDRFFGTTLQQSRFHTLPVPATWQVMLDLLPLPAALIRSAVLMRLARRIAGRFDVVLSANNEIDVGRRAVQYVHYPTYLRPRPAVDMRWYHGSRRVLDAYYHVADAIANIDPAQLRANLTLANSHWTASRIRTHMGHDPRVVYPPVISGSLGAPWHVRQNGFLVIGRISPEKELEGVMRILTLVRTQLPEVTLTIVGTVDRYVRGYYQRVRSEASSLGSWISFAQDLSRHEVRALMATHRYGLHGMREEHFGMAPAEMAMAGMIVWVPNGGGQTEIVGGEPSLVYASVQNAADAIVRVMRSEGEQQRLRELLATRSQMFSTSRFVDEIRHVVETFASAPAGGK